MEALCADVVSVVHDMSVACDVGVVRVVHGVGAVGNVGVVGGRCERCS